MKRQLTTSFGWQHIRQLKRSWDYPAQLAPSPCAIETRSLVDISLPASNPKPTVVFLCVIAKDSSFIKGCDIGLRGKGWVRYEES
jgi:hypothetical protein